MRMVFSAAKGFHRVVMTAILLSSCHGVNEGFKACIVGFWVAVFLFEFCFECLRNASFFLKYQDTRGEMQTRSVWLYAVIISVRPKGKTAVFPGGSH